MFRVLKPHLAFRLVMQKWALWLNSFPKNGEKLGLKTYIFN